LKLGVTGSTATIPTSFTVASTAVLKSSSQSLDRQSVSTLCISALM